MQTFTYIPVADHPLVPNFPVHIGIEDKHLDAIKKLGTTDTIVASVVKNKKVF